jgi:hypothetical protein
MGLSFWEKPMNGRSIWAVVAGLLVIIVVTTAEGWF